MRTTPETGPGEDWTEHSYFNHRISRGENRFNQAMGALRGVSYMLGVKFRDYPIHAIEVDAGDMRDILDILGREIELAVWEQESGLK